MADLFYTVGPQSEFRSEDLIEAGATGARLTFSFGTHDIQVGRARNLRQNAEGLQRNFLIIADLQGSKWRLGEFGGTSGAQSLAVGAGDEVELVNETRVKLSTGAKLVPVPDDDLFQRLKIGNTIVVGDSAAVLTVISDGPRKLARVEFDAVIEGRRGLFVQDAEFDPACLTEKDIHDLEHVSVHDEYDAVALSFVAGPADIEKARSIMDAAGRSKPIIAKIETAKGVEAIAAICETTDYVLIGRGDLAVSCHWSEMPALIDEVVRECKSKGVPWIMATQIAEGLRYQSLMTRAEMCDLWHWAKFGCFGILLSHETAWGPRPVDAVRFTRELLDRAERRDDRVRS